MADIIVASDLWDTSIFPEGILEKWLVKQGATVDAGEAVAQVRIADALHDLLAPASGKLVTEVAENDVVEPGTVIGRIANQ